MIKKSLLIFIVLFISYTIFIMMNKQLTSSQHQWQDQWQENILNAQNFLYNDTTKNENLIIGTSSSARIIMDSLPNFLNLSLPGQSIFDGLNILKHKIILPKNVYIEMNFPLIKESDKFSFALYFPVFFIIKKYVLSLRDDKQPIPLLQKYVISKSIKFFHHHIIDQ